MRDIQSIVCSQNLTSSSSERHSSNILKIIMKYKRKILICLILVIASSRLCQSICNPIKKYDMTNIYHCSCDKKVCGFYNDCCSPDQKQKPQYPLSNMDPPTCEIRHDFNEIPVVYMWTKCSKTYPQKSLYRTLCEVEPYSHIASFIPVYTESGLLFKNVFCGLCNFFEQSQLKFPKTSKKTHQFRITCDNQTKVEQPKSQLEAFKLLNHKKSFHCHFDINIPEYAMRMCHQNVVSTCPQKNHPKWNECENSGIIRFTLCSNSSTIYENQACAECNLGICKQRFNNPYSDVYFAFGRPSYSYDILLNMEIPSERVSNETSTEGYSLENTLSTIFVGLSIISLLILVIIHLSIKELRNNLHGILIVGLSLCLGLGMFAFIIAVLFEESKGWCRAVGILIHYLYLCTFMLMSLNAFDLVRTFLSKNIRHHSMTKKKIVTYAVIAFSIPLIIVSISVMFDIFNSESVLAPAYGDVYCWFSKPYGLLVWFYIPVCISVLFNMVVCLILICFFCRAYHQSSQTIKSRRQLVLICIKVTVILGFAWGLMLISTFVNNQIYKSIASVINSLQGVFIAISFLSNKKTLKIVQSSLSTTLSTQSSGSSASRRGSGRNSTKYTRGSLARSSGSSSMQKVKGRQTEL